MSEFDKIIKNKLHDVESPYPNDMWANIHSQLPVKKRRPYPLYFAAFAVVLITTLATYEYFDSSAKLEKSTAKTYDRYAESIKKDVHNIRQSTNNTEFDINHSQPNLELNSVGSHSNKSGNNPVNLKDIHSKENINNLSNSKPNSDHKNLIKNLEIKNTRSISNGKIDDLQIFNSINANLQSKLIANEENIDFKLLENPRNIESRHDYIAPLLPSVKRVFGTDFSKVLESIEQTMPKNMSMPCPTFVRKENSSFIEVYASNDFAIKKMSLKNNDEKPSLNNRIESETPYLSYSFGVRCGIGMNQDIAFKTGLDYTQLNEKFTYSDNNSTFNQPVKDGINIETIQYHGTTTYKKFNTYKFVDLPVLFQYSIPGTRRLSYSITAGPYINIALLTKGNILLNSEKAELLDINKSEYFKSNIGLSLYTSASIYYQLTKQSFIFIEPSVRYIPNSIATVANPLNQSYTLANVAAGFRYKL